MASRSRHPLLFPLQACFAQRIPASHLVLTNQNAADFVWGLYTGAGGAGRLGTARVHGGNVEGACTDIGKAGGTVAAACVRLGRQPKASGKAARRVLASGALRVGSRLVVIPSMGLLERQPAAYQRELDSMVAEVLNYGHEIGYDLDPVSEEAQQISQHARVFRVLQHTPRPAAAALVQPDVPALPTAAGVAAALRSAIMVPEDSLQVWVKRADGARLKLHLRLGCTGAETLCRRDDVESEQVCSHCESAYISGQPLRSLIVAPPAAGANGGLAPVAPPTPPRDVEVRHVPAAEDDNAGDAAPDLVLLAIGRGKKVHWSDECHHVMMGRSRGPAVVRHMTFEDLQRERARFKGTCSVCANRTGNHPVALLHIFQPQQ